MPEPTLSPEVARLSAEFAAFVAASRTREQELQAALDQRYAETAELSRLLVASKRREAVAKKRIATLKARLAEHEAQSNLTARLRRRLNRGTGSAR
ncbi:hypothetical protein GL325_13360 [Aeromicrobium sp. 636]|uniref:Uncharacterized protein n=1 Tax=Aeromicrobium senzhongii TaxID=2663859 RepID=A0A8I0EX65_9ACTN|nr:MULTISPECIES: hypothetical protein [Aeromicrobium]MBC9227313.1 hypothetical protein [Aeromicrobium senzhongii]MCQ3999411.1 hypothetical protein [Aeromicrobium sp. 636]MTB88277.1 hypothetical protein [Aeromicrobium senzhongii]QNL94741.1 hypothetical protein H9L21_01890 [Aeromicrobium senzhongii]